MQSAKKIVCLLCLFSLTTIAYSQSKNIDQTFCEMNAKPKVIDPLKNYEIVHENADIKTAGAFSGNKLFYSFTTTHKNKKNTVRINAKTGVLTIVPNTKDQFDVTITAKNPCGKATSTFNVIIDEET